MKTFFKILFLVFTSLFSLICKSQDLSTEDFKNYIKDMVNDTTTKIVSKIYFGREFFNIFGIDSSKYNNLCFYDKKIYFDDNKTKLYYESISIIDLSCVDKIIVNDNNIELHPKRDGFCKNYDIIDKKFTELEYIDIKVKYDPELEFSFYNIVEINKNILLTKKE